MSTKANADIFRCHFVQLILQHSMNVVSQKIENLSPYTSTFNECCVTKIENLSPEMSTKANAHKCRCHFVQPILQALSQKLCKP